MRHFLSVSVRTRLQIDGPYDEAFLEKLQKCPTEDDGSVEFAVAKVSPKLISQELETHAWFCLMVQVSCCNIYSNVS